MVLYYLLCVLGNASNAPLHTITVDSIERNQCYDDRGDVCYTQLILWEYLPYLNHHGVVAWAMADDVEPPRKVGTYYHLKITTGGRTYRVRATSYIETRTHSSQDPERKDQLTWPAKLRRGWK